jgi:hypothetical protein
MAAGSQAQRRGERWDDGQARAHSFRLQFWTHDQYTAATTAPRSWCRAAVRCGLMHARARRRRRRRAPEQPGSNRARGHHDGGGARGRPAAPPRVVYYTTDGSPAGNAQHVCNHRQGPPCPPARRARPDTCRRRAGSGATVRPWIIWMPLLKKIMNAGRTCARHRCGDDGRDRSVRGLGGRQLTATSPTGHRAPAPVGLNHHIRL